MKDDSKYKLSKDPNKSYLLFHILTSNELILSITNDVIIIENGWIKIIDFIYNLKIILDILNINDIIMLFDSVDNIGYYPIYYYETNKMSTGNMILNNIAAIPFWYHYIIFGFKNLKFRERLEINIFNFIKDLILILKDKLGNDLVIKFVNTPTNYCWAEKIDSSKHLLGFLLRTGYECIVYDIIEILNIDITKITYYEHFISNVAKSFMITKYQYCNYKLLVKILTGNISSKNKLYLKKFFTIIQSIQLDIQRINNTYANNDDYNVEKWHNISTLDKNVFKAIYNILGSMNYLRDFTDMWRINEKHIYDLKIDSIISLTFDKMIDLMELFGENISDNDNDNDNNYKDNYNNIYNCCITFFSLIPDEYKIYL